MDRAEELAKIEAFVAAGRVRKIAYSADEVIERAGAEIRARAEKLAPHRRRGGANNGRRRPAEKGMAK